VKIYWDRDNKQLLELPIMTNDSEMISGLLSPDVDLYSVEPHIFSVYPESEPIHHYDQNVDFYDRVIGNPIYNRLMWGYSTVEFTSFMRTALESRKSGWVLDAGCGSLVFTAGTYTRYPVRPVVMLDQSIGMLRAAKSRLLKLCNEVPTNVLFLQGDILQLPFRPKSFSTVISLSVLHVLEEMRVMLGELLKVREQGGNLSLSSLVLGRSWGDRYLRYLEKSGGVAAPRSVDQILDLFSDMGIPTDHYVRGNMLFIHSR
jgi:SAM-dependent methyltransferase